MQPVGKLLVLFGLLLAALGLLLVFADRIPFLGKLPGDITIRRENFRLHIPIASSLLLSVLVSLLVWVVSHFRGK